MPSKKTAPPPVVEPPEALVRLAFKEDDLRTIVDFMEKAKVVNYPEVEPLYHRMRMRLSEFQLKKLRRLTT